MSHIVAASRRGDDTIGGMQPETKAPEVWYVSYGSNLSKDRFLRYLQGGRPSGAAVTYAGARDRREPVADRPVDLPGRVYFAGESPTWGGGVAFYDHDTPGRTAARAYRITAGQFVDVAAQEMHRLPAEGDPLEEVVAGGLRAGRHAAGPGHYETLIEVGHHEGLPMLTFTAPHGSDAVPHTRPRPAYLAMLAQGLQESRNWTTNQIDAYLDGVVAAPGVR